MDITTSLDAALKRAAMAIVSDIAKDGLLALQGVLDASGFSKSDYLKNYELYSHVNGSEIVFEIVLDVEAVVSDDEATQQVIEEQAKMAAELEEQAQKSFHLERKTRKVRRLQGLHDARKPARDARKPARDARKNAQDRLLEHELARLAPRSARVTREGKLSIALRRSIQNTKTDVVFPQDKFQGILNNFVTKLKDLIHTMFIPEFQEIVQSYVST